MQDPLPRLRRRKALPEKLPPMMSPIKSLFGRRTNAGLMLGLPGHQATTGGLPGVCFPGAKPSKFYMKVVLAMCPTTLRVLAAVACISIQFGYAWMHPVPSIVARI